jgi:hypothetical protein
MVTPSMNERTCEVCPIGAFTGFGMNSKICVSAPRASKIVSSADVPWIDTWSGIDSGKLSSLNGSPESGSKSARPAASSTGP